MTLPTGTYEQLVTNEQMRNKPFLCHLVLTYANQNKLSIFTQKKSTINTDHTIQRVYLSN